MREPQLHLLHHSLCGPGREAYTMEAAASLPAASQLLLGPSLPELRSAWMVQGRRRLR